jgi:signal transduction histidine kinase
MGVKISCGNREFNFNDNVENLIENYFSNEPDGRTILLEKKTYENPIQTDESVMTHILTNLISNAFKYSSGEKNPKVIINYLPNTFKIQVINYGIGIPEAEMKHLFKSFFRASNTTSIKGSGLGLHIAKQFTELLQGTITLSSKVNQMTNLTLEFPYQQQPKPGTEQPT